MKRLFASLLVSIALLAAPAHTEEVELDRSARKLVELLHAKKWTRLARQFYVNDVAQYRRLFPNEARGLTRAQLEDDIILGRNSLKLDAGQALLDARVDLSEWTYLKTFHSARAGDDGMLVISLFKNSKDGVDRLDITLYGVIDGGTIVLFGGTAIDMERSFGYD